MNSVVRVTNIRKNYFLYNKKSDKLKEAFSITRKKYHKDFEALKGISFSINRGECVGIIGVNGSGKSTLLKILAGVIQATEGEVKTEGTIAALLELGAGFNPEYTGLENIYLNTLLMGFNRTQTDKKLQDILEFADIGQFIYQPVKTYSSGMFVRLAFSIAIMVEPDILIIDEALSVGDVFFQQKCYNKIRELSQRATVIMVSHDLNAITKFCKRAMVMNNGVLIYDGDVRTAVTEYYKIKQGNYTSSNNIEKRYSEFGIEKFIKPKQGQYSGNMDVLIESYFYQVDNVPFAEYCEYGQTVDVRMLAYSNRRIEATIVGYQVRDKYGNEMFGETSLTSGYTDVCLEQGKNLISFQFEWPEIREGDYFITLGIGEGYEVLRQVEQCWVNQAIHMVNIGHNKLIYGIFNNTMDVFNVDRI